MIETLIEVRVLLFMVYVRDPVPPRCCAAATINKAQTLK